MIAFGGSDQHMVQAKEATPLPNPSWMKVA
jgi:hypothetical protein